MKAQLVSSLSSSTFGDTTACHADEVAMMMPAGGGLKPVAEASTNLDPARLDRGAVSPAQRHVSRGAGVAEERADAVFRRQPIGAVNTGRERHLRFRLLDLLNTADRDGREGLGFHDADRFDEVLLDGVDRRTDEN